MRERTKYTLAASAAMVLLLAMDLAFLRRAPAPRPEIKLPDGRIVQLAGSTEGALHSLTSRWHAPLRRLLPTFIAEKLGPEFSASFGFGRPGLALWLMCYDPATATWQRNWMNRCTLLDEHGCEIPSQGYGSTSDGVYDATVVNFSAYPRQASSFTLRIYDRNDKVLADFPIPNEHPSPPPVVWTPESLPAWKTNGALALRLDRSRYDHLQPDFQIFRNGQAENFWVANDVWFEDPSGNTGQFLCRKLPLWKWRARFHRSAEAPFAPEESTTFTNVTLPPPGQLISLPVAARFGASELTKLMVAGPGRYDFSNGVLVASVPWRAGMSQVVSSSGSSTDQTETRATDKTALFLPRLRIPEGFKLIVRARNGKEMVSATHHAGSTTTFQYLDFAQSVTNQTVDLDFVVDQGYDFEAVLSPQDLRSTP